MKNTNELELKEAYMTKLDEEVIKLLVKLGKKSGIPTEQLGIETFTCLLTIVCRIGIEIGLTDDEGTDLYRQFFNQIKNTNKDLDYIDEFENEKPDYILNKKKAN